MSSGSSGSIVERIIAWLRGFLASPQGERQDTTSRQQDSAPEGGGTATDTTSVGRGAGEITEPLRDTTTTAGGPGATAETGAASERQVLPDLDDSESDYEYSGPGSAQAASDQSEEEHLSGDLSDFEDAGGDVEPESVSYPNEGSEDGMDEIHNAVGRHEEEDDEERIDTSRDHDFEGRELESDNVPEARDEDLEGVSDQDELTTFEGASTDEFAAGGYAPAPTEEDDVEAAAESTSQHDMNNLPVADTQSGMAREEIESKSEGDAFAQGDEAVTAPGQGDSATFSDASTGTTQPSRSATGSDVDVDVEQDALGTTLEYTEDEESSFDAEEANLSAEGELGVMDDRVAQAADVTGETAVTENSYADLPDTSTPEDADDTGRDDFAGSEYPSDRRVDRLGGDDAFDAMEPDIDEATSAAGDLEDSGAATSFGQPAIEQEMVGASDEHVGGEEPGFVENMQDIDVPSGESAADSAPEGSGLDAGTAGATLAGTDVDVPAGAVRGDGTTDTPQGYPIKGNANSMIYHLPAFPSYKNTKAEFCFATEQDAIAAGYRAPGRRNRGRANQEDAPGASTGSQETSTAANAGPSGIDFEEPIQAASSTSEAAPDEPEASIVQTDAPAGAVAGDGTNTCPPGYPIKGNATSMIYHAPGRASYDATVAEWCFATEEDALNAGYRAPKR